MVPEKGNRTFRTRAVHAGETANASARPLTDSIAQGSVYAFSDPAGIDGRFSSDPVEPTYSRGGMPNAFALERAVAGLEGAEAAFACASGMAAISLVFLAHLSAGDHVVAGTDGYCDTNALLTEELSRFGVDVAFADASDAGQIRAAATDKTRLIYAETISNPSLKLADLSGLSEVSRSLGALLCIDNTFATPALCRPLEHGADLVVHSATKFLGGHHDLSAGVAVGRADLIARVRRCGYLFGPTVAPLDAWLALRGIKTLAPRMAWSSETAALIATFLASHPAVAAVRYPGLPDHPQQALARELLPDGGGAMVAFDLADGADAAAFVRGLDLILYAPSLGGASTTVCYPPRTMAGGVACAHEIEPHGATLRLSIGLEAAADLIEDLAQALDRAGKAAPAAPARV